MQKFIKLRCAVEIHDAVSQFLALIPANYVAAERGEFHGDFILGHWIAGIALGCIHTRAV